MNARDLFHCESHGSSLGPEPVTLSAETLRAGETTKPGSSLIGTLLDQRYRVIEQIGRGGMSRIYRAEHVLLGRSVAIKTLLDDVSEDRELISRILREARATAAIASPHVVEIMDVGRLPRGGFYLVLEYLRGSDVSSLVKARGPLDVRESLDIALQLCAAVGAAHSAGVIHRDIKPHNVFVTASASRCVKLLDFGICKLARKTDCAGTLSGTLLGTPSYMAPEQVDGLGRVGPYTDIYAIGATLHFMLTGRPPFEAISLPRLLLQICEGRLTPLEHLPEVTRVLERALAKQPGDRFCSAESLRAALADLCPPSAGARLCSNDWPIRSQQRIQTCW